MMDSCKAIRPKEIIMDKRLRTPDFQSLTENKPIMLR